MTTLPSEYGMNVTVSSIHLFLFDCGRKVPPFRTAWVLDGQRLMTSFEW